MALILDQCVGEHWKAGSLEEVEKIIAGLEYPVKIPMDCGSVAVWEKPEDVPRATMPCPCGHPLHWVVVVQIVP